MKKFLKKEYVMPVLAIVLAIAVVTGVSYAIFQVTTTGTKNNVINAGTLQLTFDESSSNEISLTDAVPLTDATGMQGTPYTFTITNTGTLDAQYRLMIEENDELYASHGDEDRIFPNGTLRIGLTKNGTTTYVNYERSSLDSGVLKPQESITYTARIWINYDAGNEVQGNHFHGHFTVEAIQTNDIFPGAAQTILANNTVKTETPDFSTSNGTGLYQAEDDDGTSYYFRGNVTNNWVKFASDFDEWLYWRIIRINGDGTIRLLYNGTTTTTTGSGTVIDGDYYMSSSGMQEKYMGYTYDRSSDETDSGLKQKIDAWYADTVGSVNTDYDQYVATGKFCNDTSGGTTSGNVKSYASVTRMNNHTPSLKCPQTTEDYGGSYLLKAGTVTLDEMVMAGATSTANSNYYMYNGLNYGTWTMTPGKVDSSSSTKIPYYWQQQPNGSISNVNSYASSIWVRPVINLRADVQLTGTGTASDPYEIVES